MAFEGASVRVVANAEDFGRQLAELKNKGRHFRDAQPLPELIQAGDFDLSGMLATPQALVRWNHPECGLVFPASFIGPPKSAA